MKSRNEIASEEFDRLWREFYDKNPREKKKLLDNAEKARAFLRRLREDLRRES